MTDITYTVIRSNRKSIALVIGNDANLIVRAPQKATDKEITDLVHKKERWIKEKQNQVSIFGEKHSPLILNSGESVLYLGNIYTIIRGAVDEIVITGTIMMIPLVFQKSDVIGWMKAEAERVLSERVKKYSSLTGTSYSSLRLSDAKARWGSCGANGSLNFAWRLVMCPISVIDYIVVHELSHIAYKNHSEGFWARVKTVLPNYMEQQDWLKINRKIMDTI
ncbi:MAG: M48 family metallopeptidase [Christensenellales bacterium]